MPDWSAASGTPLANGKQGDAQGDKVQFHGKSPCRIMILSIGLNCKAVSLLP
jgi:hypothetical protein